MGRYPAVMRVAVQPMLLACCAMEAATALRCPPVVDGMEWVLDHGTRDVTVVVLAGTITEGKQQAVLALIDAAPHPRAVIAFGVCASSGGPYWDSYAVAPGWDSADLFVPGCPPPPQVFWTAVAEAAKAVVVDAAG